LAEANQNNAMVRRLPSLSEVEAWLASARQLETVLEY
jgi:hypothetical protein